MDVALVSLALLAAGWLEVGDASLKGCVDVRRLEARVAAELGRAPFVASDGVRVRAHLIDVGRDRVARLDLLDERGEVVGARQMVARNAACADLETALTLTLVLALAEADPVVALPPSVPVGQATSAPVVPAVVTTADLPTGEAISWQGWLGADGVTGGLPGWGFGGFFEGRAQRGPLSLGAEGRLEWSLPVRRAGAPLETWRATGALLPCVRAGRGAGCGVVRAGLLRAASARSSSSPTLDVGARLVLGFLGGATSVFLEPSLSLARTRLSIDRTVAWTTPRFSLAAGFMVLLW